MKNFCLIICFLALSQLVNAQKFIPQIGIGTTLNYNVIATNMGQQVPLNIKIISLNDPMKFNWNLPGLGNGNFIIPVKALESGTKMRLQEPNPNSDTQFKDDETIIFISKAMLTDLITNQTFTINKIKFSAKPADAYLINSKEANVIHAISANSKVEVWILNNPAFPLICKLTGNPAGIDFDLKNIKE